MNVYMTVPDRYWTVIKRSWNGQEWSETVMQTFMQTVGNGERWTATNA